MGGAIRLTTCAASIVCDGAVRHSHAFGRRDRPSLATTSCVSMRGRQRNRRRRGWRRQRRLKATGQKVRQVQARWAQCGSRRGWDINIRVTQHGGSITKRQSTVGRGCLCGSCGLSLLLLAPPAALWRLPGLVQAMPASLSPPVAVAAVLRTLALDAGGECLTWPAGGQAGELGEGGGGAAGGQPTVSEASRGSTAAATTSAASRICANRAGMNRRQRKRVSASSRIGASLRRYSDLLTGTAHHISVHREVDTDITRHIPSIIPPRSRESSSFATVSLSARVQVGVEGRPAL